MNLKQKWQELNSREQGLIAIMSVFVGVFLFVTFVWKPLNTNVEKARVKLEKQQQLSSWVQDNVAKYRALSRLGGKRSSGSLSSVVNNTAKRLGITVARMQPQGDDLQVWVDEVPFNALLTWLDELTRNQNLRVLAIDIAPSGTEGMVKIRRMQVTKG